MLVGWSDAARLEGKSRGRARQYSASIVTLARGEDAQGETEDETSGEDTDQGDSVDEGVKVRLLHSLVKDELSELVSFLRI